MNDKEIMGLNDLYSMYKNKDYSYETLFDAEVFLSHPKQFNDPFDCFVLIDKNEFDIEYLGRIFGHSIIQKINKFFHHTPFFENIEFMHSCKKYKADLYPKEFDCVLEKDLEMLKNGSLELYDKYCSELDKVRNRFGIACFTINKPSKNMVMWAHYAENYDGFCAKYDFGNIKFRIGTKECDEYAYYILKHLKKVKYTKTFPRIDVKKLLDIPIDKIIDSKFAIGYVKKTLDKKYFQWKYENEYRLIIDKEDKNIEIISPNEKGFKIKFPYLRELYIFSSKNTLRKRLVIEEIAKKHKVKYLWLTTNKGNVELIEDKSTFSEHNFIIDASKYSSVD